MIKGGTLINPEWNSTKNADISNGYVLIEGGEIKQTGIYSDEIFDPVSMQLIDATGKYIVPGLIDGFAVINNQEYANAFLLSGVTSIIGVESFRRGKFFHNAVPSPEVFMLGEVGDTTQNKEEITFDFENSVDENMRMMLLMYKLTPELLQHSLDLTKEYQIGSIGELGFTSYEQGMEMNVDAFVHTTRYSLDIAPDEMAMAVAHEPFSNELNSPKWRYYQYLSSIDVKDSSVIEHAMNIGASNTYLMPTLSLLYLDLPSHKNPWKEDVAAFIDAKDIDSPADRNTGNHTYEKDIQEAYTTLAVKEIELEKKYYEYGAKYITGSGCDVWGTMPGISLHTELELLQRIGLNNRQLLASASSNFSNAFGWKKGRLEPGYDADILILDKNPLEDIKNLKSIDRLLLKGEAIDLKSLHK